MRAIARYGSTAGINDVTFDITAYINYITINGQTAMV